MCASSEYWGPGRLWGEDHHVHLLTNNSMHAHSIQAVQSEWRDAVMGVALLCLACKRSDKPRRYSLLLSQQIHSLISSSSLNSGHNVENPCCYTLKFISDAVYKVLKAGKPGPCCCRPISVCRMMQPAAPDCTLDS